MRRWFLGVGLIIIVAGVLMIASYNLPRTSITEEERVGYASQSKIVSADLYEGDLVRLLMTQGLDWREGYFEIDDLLYPGFGILYVGVNITDPQGKNITFLTTWTPMAMENVEKPPLTYLDKNVTTNLTMYSGGIDPYANGSNYRPPSNSFFEVGGMVKITGKYFFQVWGIVPSREDPPASLDVRTHRYITTYTLTYMLPAGIVVAGAGMATVAFSIWSKPKKGRNRKIKSS